MEATYQLTPAEHKPLPSAFHLLFPLPLQSYSHPQHIQLSIHNTSTAHSTAFHAQDNHSVYISNTQSIVGKMAQLINTKKKDWLF